MFNNNLTSGQNKAKGSDVINIDLSEHRLWGVNQLIWKWPKSWDGFIQFSYPREDRPNPEKPTEKCREPVHDGVGWKKIARYSLTRVASWRERSW